jgi:hypothetical protein
VGGNAGSLTLNVTGAGFTPGTAVTLRDGGSTIATASVEFINSYHLLATFNLSGAPLGVYDLHASDGANQDSLADAFTVVEGVGPLLAAELVMQPVTRSNIPFRASVVFENVGDANLELPLMRVQAPPGGQVWPRSADRFGATESLQFIAVSQDHYNGGVLAPGQQGRFEFWGVIPAVGDTNFTLTILTKDNTDPFDAEALREQVRPDPMPTRWDDAFDLVAADLGATYGSFAAGLADAADEARGYGVQIQSVRQLLGYMIERAIVFDLPADIRGKLYVNTNGVVTPLARARLNAVLPLDLSDPLEGGAAGLTWHDGSFALHGLPVGELEVIVANHHSPSPATLVYSGAPQMGVEITVLAGGVIRGFVREEGLWWGYIAEATVEARNEEGVLLATAVTDGWGRYRLTGLPLHETIYMSAASDRFLPSAVTTATLTTLNPFTRNIDMNAGGSIGGVVYDPNGQPVEGALVQANPTQADFGRTTVSGPGGFYRFDGLFNGVYQITAAVVNFAPGVVENVTVVESTLTSNIDPQMQTAGALNVTVTDTDSGVPLVGAAVIPQVAGLFTYQTNTLGGGLAALTGLAAGAVPLQISADGYHTAVVTPTITAGQTASLSVSLRANGAIGGTVQRSGGAPLANIPVTITGERLPAPVTITTNSNGQFTFTNVADGAYGLSLGGDDASLSGAAVQRQSVTLSEAVNGVNLLWQVEAAVVSGRVFAADGVTPLANARVDLLRDNDRLEATVTDSDGRYRFLVLASGSYTLAAARADVGVAVANVVVTVGADLADQNLTMSGGGLTLNLTHNGNPVSGALVALRRDGWPERTAWLLASDPAGQATLPRLAAGNYTAVILKSGLVETELSFVHGAGGQTINAPLADGRTVAGQLLTDYGASVQDASLLFINELTGQTIEVSADLNGAYSLNRLADGDYIVWAISGGGRFQPAQTTGFAVSGPGPYALDIEVNTMGAAVAGYVTDADGEPIANAILSLRHPDGNLLGQSTTDFNGFYRINRVPQGQFNLAATAIGYGPTAAVSVNIPLTGQALVNVNLGAAQAVALLPGGSMVSLANVVANESGVGAGTLVSGLPQPQLPNLNLEAPPFPTDLDTSDPCANALIIQHTNMRNAEKKWQGFHRAQVENYDAAVSQGLVNTGLISTRTAIIGGKMIAFVGSMKLMLAGSSAPASLAYAESAISIASNVKSALDSGQFDVASAGLDTLSALLANSDTNVITAQLSIAKEAYELFKDLETTHGDQMAFISINNTLEDNKFSAIKDFHRERQKFQALLDQVDQDGCGGSGGGGGGAG